MAFKGRDAKRSKIVINNKIIEQVNTFNYLGNLVPYEKEKRHRQQNYKIFKDSRTNQ
jgi:predicted ATP-grasp superfamily ATP-dependent carboligase